MPDFHPSQSPSGKNDARKNDERAETERAVPLREPPAIAPEVAPAMPRIPLTEETITFRDAGGALWWAHEVSGEALGAPGRMCLLLISGTRLRRVWTYPAHWRSLPPEELLALADSSD